MTQLPANNRDDGQASVIGEILLVGLIVLLCAIILALSPGYFTALGEESFLPPPEIITIVSVDHYNEGVKTFAGKVTLRNIGSKYLKNIDYYAEVYINDVKQHVIIGTLKANEFIPTEHYGIKTISGSGPSGSYWEPGYLGVFDLLDKMVQPGCLLRIDIMNKADGTVFSRSEILVI